MSETKTLKLTFVNTADRGISQTLIEDILQKYLPCNIVVATEGNPAPILKTNDLLIETVTVTTEVIDSKTDGSGSGSGSAVEVAGSSGGADRSATATPIQSQIQILEQELRDKNKLISELEYTNTKSLASIQAFHKQQKNLFDEFVLLRTKYDEVKHSLVVILWKYCALCHPDLREIPRQQVTIEDGGQFVENADQIGDYRVGDLLGEGQFASVRLCWKLRPGAGVQVASGGDDELQRDLALKIMNKDRIVSFTMLKRVSNELYALRILSSPYVVRLVDVLHGENKLYIITEKGGESDLFEFFDAHPEGVVESWAMSILYYIMKALLFVHSKGICHRDLKPENILVAFNSELGICTDLKLCDFGLSTTFSTTTMLTDFCGSPGFFAPEMIIKSKSAMAMAAAGGLDGSIHNHNSSTGGGGSGGLKSPGYYGDKADIWSVGCVLLELMLGHELFCELWMSAYDYENIQNKIKFQDAISCSVSALGDELDRLNEDQQAAVTETDGASAPPAFSPSLVQYILDILNLDDIARPTAYAITQSNWCCHLFQQEKQEKEQKDKEIAEKLAAVSLGMPKGVGRIDGGKKSTASSGAGSGSGSGGRKSRHRSMGGQTSEDEYLKAAAASSSKANRSASDDVVSSSTPQPGASTVAADSGAAGGGTEVTTTTATATTTEDNLAETAAVESNESSASTNETASASAGGNALLPAEDLDTVMPLKSDLASHQHDFRVAGKDDAAAAADDDDDDDGDVGRDFTTIRYTHSRDSMEPHRARERHETATTEDLADTLFHLEGDDAAKQDAIKSVEAAKVLAHEQLDPQARPQISQKERKLYSEHAQQTHHSIKLPPAVIREDENSNSSGISLGENGELLDLRGQRQRHGHGQTDRQLSFNDDSIVGTTTATATASATAVMASPPSVKGGGAMGRTEPIYRTPQHPSHSTARSAALASQTAPPNINSNSNADASASTNANANAAVFTSASVGAVIGTGASTGTSTGTGTGTGNAVVSAVSPDAHGDTLSSLSVGVPALDPQQRFGPIRGGASIPSLLLETPGQTPGPTPGGSEGNSPVVLHLPPVISSTPSVYKAKKILKKGDVLAHQAEMGDWRTPMGSPGGTSRLMMSKENSRTGDELMSEEQQNYEALSRHSNYHHQQHHNNNHHQHQHTAAAIAHGLTGDSTAVTTAAIASNNTNNTNSSSDSNTAAAATGAGLDHGGDGGDKTE